MVTLENVKANERVISFIKSGDEYLGATGFTEHGLRHASLVAHIAKNIMVRLKYDERTAELAAMAAYLHDIGNVVSRHNHGQTGSMIALEILTKLNMPDDEAALVVSAIGNHEEEYGLPVNLVSAALIMADKSDVHRSRVRNQDMKTFDMHDRVNYAAEHSFLRVNEEERTITLELSIDTSISPVMEYFEIFLSRMSMCRKAASFLDCHFVLMINEVKLL